MGAKLLARATQRIATDAPAPPPRVNHEAVDPSVVSVLCDAQRPDHRAVHLDDRSLLALRVQETGEIIRRRLPERHLKQPGHEREIRRGRRAQAERWLMRTAGWIAGQYESML